MVPLQKNESSVRRLRMSTYFSHHFAHHLVHRKLSRYNQMMNLKYSIRTMLFTAGTVLTVGMNLGISTVRLVHSFSPQEGRPIVSFRRKSCCRTGRFPLNTVSESSDTRSPSPNGRAPQRNQVFNPPSSRSTAVFAMYESMRRQAAIAVRVMENDPTYKSLEGRDRAFARLLLTTAERRHGQIDKVIEGLARITKTKKVRSTRG